MKHLKQFYFVIALLIPAYSYADSHEDATMDVLEHLDSAEVTHEITLPEETGKRAIVKHHVHLPDHANDKAHDKLNENRGNRDDSREDHEDNRNDSNDAVENAKARGKNKKLN